MKTIKNILATLTLVTIAAFSVNAQNPVESATAEASATIITPIGITKVEGADLRFGNIIASEGGGTVRLGTENDTPEYTGVTAPTGNQGTRQRASFTVTGMAQATYAITLPTSPVTISTEDNTNSMTIDTFVSNPNGTGTIGAGGNQTINVGATLNVQANQAAGEYSGNFDVTVVYN